MIEDDIKELEGEAILDLEVMLEYFKNLTKEELFSLEGLYTVRAIAQTANVIIEKISILSSCNVARKNEAVKKIIIRVEGEIIGEGEEGDNHLYA